MFHDPAHELALSSDQLLNDPNLWSEPDSVGSIGSTSELSDSEENNADSDDSDQGLLETFTGSYQSGPRSLNRGDNTFNNDHDDIVDHFKLDPVNKSSKLSNKGSQKRHKPQAKKLSHEVLAKLHEANVAFAQQADFQRARDLLNEVIRIDSGVLAAWRSLSAIFCEMNLPEKQLKTLFIAAIIAQRNYHLWLDCARLSFSLAKYEQADICFRKALRSLGFSASKPISCFKRKVLLKVLEILMAQSDNHRLGKLNFEMAVRCAKDAYEIAMYLKISKLKKQCRQNLAFMYHVYEQYSEAIQLYENHLDSFIRYPEPPSGTDVFDWEDLSILADLYSSQHKYRKVISIISRVGRWLLGRKEETFWDYFPDDREWDERRFQVAEFRARYSKNHQLESSKASFKLSVRLRIALGIARCKVHEFQEGIRHLSFLSTYKFEEQGTASLAFEAALAIEEAQDYSLALETLLNIESSKKFRSPELFQGIARNLTSFEKYEQAISWLLMASREGFGSFESSLQLAKLYEVCDQSDKAFQVISELKRLRDSAAHEVERRDQSNVNNSSNFQDEESEQDMLLFKKSKSSARGMKKKAFEQFQAQQKRKSEQIEGQFRMLQLINEKEFLYKSQKVKSYLNMAFELIDEFGALREVFSREKSEQMKAHYFSRSKASPTLDEYLVSMSGRLNKLSMVKPPNSLSDKVYGITLENWLKLYLSSGFLIMQHFIDNFLDPNLIFKDCLKPPIFSKTAQTIVWIKNAWLAAVAQNGMFLGRSEAIRHYTLQFSNNKNIHKVWSVVNSSGQEAIETFSHANSMKSVLRLIKSRYDQSDDAKLKMEKHMGSLYLMYGQILAAKTSLKPALAYYGRAFHLAPNDPMLNLCLGINYLHMAMQRLTIDRHYQILQAFLFFNRYKKFRIKANTTSIQQEVCYNLGRAFHQIGLFQFALQEYEKAISLSKDLKKNESMYNLSLDASYNLAFIYKSSGNMPLARKIIAENIVI